VVKTQLEPKLSVPFWKIGLVRLTRMHLYFSPALHLSCRFLLQNLFGFLLIDFVSSWHTEDSKIGCFSCHLRYFRKHFGYFTFLDHKTIDDNPIISINLFVVRILRIHLEQRHIFTSNIHSLQVNVYIFKFQEPFFFKSRWHLEITSSIVNSNWFIKNFA